MCGEIARRVGADAGGKFAASSAPPLSPKPKPRSDYDWGSWRWWEVSLVHACDDHRLGSQLRIHAQSEERMKACAEVTQLFQLREFARIDPDFCYYSGDLGPKKTGVSWHDQRGSRDE